ncbi:hypothetical protein [Mucilaginibacter paludis]|uniref:hypothetical protein n=1 Tax=Mucilaginibacter paludis TaxID=423351 RepID=UPI0012F7D2CC|nr:hypothetical protein [Mucilaginibacter paludis]
MVDKQPFFLVSKVTGITPAGRPIDFEATSKRPKLKLPYLVDLGSAIVCDIYIEDLHPLNEANVNENDEKYSLIKTIVPNPDKQTPQLFDNRLYLGRYKLTQERDPEIISPPFIYSLSSFNFPSEQWQAWTWPIREALRKLVKKNPNRDAEIFLKNIVYNYPFMPLSTFFRSCYQLKWFCKSDKSLDELLEEEIMEDLQTNLMVNPFPESLEKMHPQDIPVTISNILEQGEDVIEWRLLPKAIITEKDNEIIINRNFKTKSEIKFRFANKLEDVERLFVDKFFLFDVEPSVEPDNNNRSTYCYIISYPGSISEDDFTISKPDAWGDLDFSVYYRTVM